MKNQNITLKTILFGFALLYAAAVPKAFAVVPPPDGCYPNFTTAEGCNALNSLTTGTGNTGVGWRSLFLNTTGSFNTGVGAGALVLSNGDANTATGAVALLLNTTGTNNTANGATALLNNTQGSFNNAFGDGALFNHQNGAFNSAVGSNALFSNVNGNYNNAHGDGALASNVNGDSNTAVGDLALNSSTGSNNTALGAGAGFSNETGSNNIYIGDTGLSDESNVIAIGAMPPSGMDYTDTFIGGVYDGLATERAVYVNSSGRIGTLSSSRRYKEEIKAMDNASEAVLALKPVKFRYKQEIDPSHKLSFGLIAEEVAEISPDLVGLDKEGNPQTVRYEAVNAMLLNEFLKEHRTVQEQGATITALRANDAKQEATIAQQQKQIEMLTEGLQRVSAQLEMKDAPQTVLNDQ